jgi:hypothetical protein
LVQPFQPKILGKEHIPLDQKIEMKNTQLQQKDSIKMKFKKKVIEVVGMLVILLEVRKANMGG